MRHHALALVMLLCAPPAVFAQDARGASVSGLVSAALFDSETEVSLSGAFGYQFSRVVGFELEATVVPTLGSAYPDDRFTILAGSPAIAIYPPPRFENADGRMVILANQVRLAVPAGSGRLEPYFVAGGGVASVRRTADYVWIYPYYCPACLATAEGLPSEIARGLLAPSPGAFTERIASSSVELALTIGGGLSVRVTSELSVDADLRAFRLLGEQDRTVGRFGVGVRYRF